MKLLIILRGELKIWDAGEERNMKETRWGLAMLDIYEANGEWIFSDLCDEGAESVVL